MQLLKHRYGAGLAALLQARGLDVRANLEPTLRRAAELTGGLPVTHSYGAQPMCRQIVQLVGALGETPKPAFVLDGMDVVEQVSAPPLAEGGAAWCSAVDAMVRHATIQPAALVADGDPVQRKFAATVLARAGWTVNVARTRKEFLDFVGALRYDLILLEQSWPDGSGSSAAREIRGGGGPSASAYILGCSSTDARSTCLEAGMDAYLQKPIDLASLRMRALRVASGILRPPSEP
jgi:CheY-like chemotaxis protein